MSSSNPLIVCTEPLLESFRRANTLGLARHHPLPIEVSPESTVEDTEMPVLTIRTEETFAEATFRWGGEPAVHEHASRLVLMPSHPQKDTEPLGFLGRRILREGLGWESFQVKGVCDLKDYKDWGMEIVHNHASYLTKPGIYGAVYASLGSYTIDEETLKAFMECWNADHNVFLTRWGSLSLSLLDVQIIGGLRVYGSLYEEYVPTNRELENGKGFSGKHGQPLKYLLQYYQHLRMLSTAGNCQRVTFALWIDFFVYGKHRGKTSTKFSGVKSYQKKTYIAAFLSLWLCCFVLPSHDGCIRPGVFVMASRMVDQGEKFSLATPVLCSLYQSLNERVRHPIGPGKVNSPWAVHYLIGWLACYFPTLFPDVDKLDVRRQYPDFARDTDIPFLLRLSGFVTPSHTAEDIRWHLGDREDSSFVRWRLFHDNPYLLHKRAESVDDGQMRHRDFTFLLCIRRAVLILRMGDKLMSEPYNPQWFGRQFGYDQGIPEEGSPCDRDEVDLGRMTGHWNHFMRQKTRTKFIIPEGNRRGVALETYVQWYQLSMDNFYDVDMKRLYSGSCYGRLSEYTRRQRLIQSNQDQQVSMKAHL